MYSTPPILGGPLVLGSQPSDAPKTPEQAKRRMQIAFLQSGAMNHIDNSGLAGAAAQIANGMAYRREFGPAEHQPMFSGSPAFWMHFNSESRPMVSLGLRPGNR